MITIAVASRFFGITKKPGNEHFYPYIFVHCVGVPAGYTPRKSVAEPKSMWLKKKIVWVDTTKLLSK